jgi:hypothetical protein
VTGLVVSRHCTWRPTLPCCITEALAEPAEREGEWRRDEGRRRRGFGDRWRREGVPVRVRDETRSVRRLTSVRSCSTSFGGRPGVTPAIVDSTPSMMWSASCASSTKKVVSGVEASTTRTTAVAVETVLGRRQWSLLRCLVTAAGWLAVTCCLRRLSYGRVPGGCRIILCTAHFIAVLGSERGDDVVEFVF